MRKIARYLMPVWHLPVLTCRWRMQELLASPGDVEDDDDASAVVY